MTDREAAIWLLNVTADIGKTEHRDLWHYEQALSEIKEMLESQPERKKGHWERVYPTRSKSYLRFCSVCRKQCWYCGIEDYDFCPNCGADMRGESDEVN